MTFFRKSYHSRKNQWCTQINRMIFQNNIHELIRNMRHILTIVPHERGNRILRDDHQCAYFSAKITRNIFKMFPWIPWTFKHYLHYQGEHSFYALFFRPLVKKRLCQITKNGNSEWNFQILHQFFWKKFD